MNQLILIKISLRSPHTSLYRGTGFLKSSDNPNKLYIKNSLKNVLRH